MLTSWSRAERAAGNASRTSPSPPVRARGASSLPAKRILIGWRIGAEALTPDNRESDRKRPRHAEQIGPRETGLEARRRGRGRRWQQRKSGQECAQKRCDRAFKNPLV